MHLREACSSRAVRCGAIRRCRDAARPPCRCLQRQDRLLLAKGRGSARTTCCPAPVCRGHTSHLLQELKGAAVEAPGPAALRSQQLQGILYGLKVGMLKRQSLVMHGQSGMLRGGQMSPSSFQKGQAAPASAWPVKLCSPHKHTLVRASRANKDKSQVSQEAHSHASAASRQSGGPAGPAGGC